MPRPPRILIFTHHEKASFNLVAKGPFTALAAGGYCEVRYLRAIDRRAIGDLLWCDALFLVRPTGGRVTAMARLARRCRRHVVVYWDDDILAVPRERADQPTRHELWRESPLIRRSVRNAVEAADVLAVANPRVIDAFRGHGIRVPRTAVLKVPALGVDFTRGLPPHRDRPVPTIGFAGGIAHAGFLEQTVLPALAYLRREGIDFRFELAGPDLALPGDLATVTRRYAHVEFDRWLALRNRLDWDVALAPLPEGLFFACKFNIKFVEYAAAGIPCIYSDVPPYAGTIEHGVTGWLTGNSVAAWADAIRILLGDATLRARMRDAVWAKLAIDHSMEAVMKSYRDELAPAMAPR